MRPRRCAGDPAGRSRPRVGAAGSGAYAASADVQVARAAAAAQALRGRVAHLEPGGRGADGRGRRRRALQGPRPADLRGLRRVGRGLRRRDRSRDRHERRLGRRGARLRHQPAPVPQRGDRLERAHREGRLHPRLHALLQPRGPLRHRGQLPPRVDPRPQPLVQLRLPDPARAPHGQDAAQAPRRAPGEAADGGTAVGDAHGRDPRSSRDAPRLRALAHPPRQLLQRRRRLELLQGDGEVPGRRRGGEGPLPEDGRPPPRGALVRPRVPALRRGLRRRFRERGRARAGPRGRGPSVRDPARRGAAAVRPAHRAIQEARHARRLLGEGPARLRPGPRRLAGARSLAPGSGARRVRRDHANARPGPRGPEEELRRRRAQGLDAARPRPPARAAGLAGGHRRDRRAGPRASLHARQLDLPHERLPLPARARALPLRGARLPRPLDPRLRRPGRGRRPTRWPTRSPRRATWG